MITKCMQYKHVKLSVLCASKSEDNIDGFALIRLCLTIPLKQNIPLIPVYTLSLNIIVLKSGLYVIK